MRRGETLTGSGTSREFTIRWRTALTALAVVAMVVVGCGHAGTFIVGNHSTAAIIVQPEQPLGEHAAWLIRPGEQADETDAEPGSVVHIFSLTCIPIVEFTVRGSGFGVPAYALEADGTIHTSDAFNIFGDPGPGATEYEPCPHAGGTSLAMTVER